MFSASSTHGYRAEGGSCTSTAYDDGVERGLFIRCRVRCFQAVNTWHGFLPPGAYPCWARKAGTPPYSSRTTAASAILSWPGRKKEPIAVSCPQPHQQVPVGSKRPVICYSSLAAIQDIAPWMSHSPSTRDKSAIWRQICDLNVAQRNGRKLSHFFGQHFGRWLYDLVV